MSTRIGKRVWEVCEPHPDVFGREMDLSIFAISLSHVVKGSADRDYSEAKRFFSLTYMTRALRDVLERVVRRLAGQGLGAPILRLETPFGGGKTHTMTALYHLARSPEEVSEHPAMRGLLEPLELESLPRGVHVAVLDGRGLNVRGRTTDDGTKLRTLWGELAYQLGGREGYEMLAEADTTRTSPGGVHLTRLLERYQPALVLMDEVLEYLIKARAEKVGDSNLTEQSLTFLGDLTTAVGDTQRSVLAVALPASSLEISADTQETAERLFQYVKKVFGRMELVETPVTQDEIFGVLRCRLFQSVGEERDRKKAVEAMRSYYDEYARFFPDRVRSQEYKQRMLEAYPFHPELIDLLYERWGPHPQFQRTRGALRLLALVLRRLWNQRPASAYLIQPHHIDLEDRHIRGDVVRLLDSSWDPIATGDVVQRAKEIDRRLGSDYAKEALGKGAATCTFLYSISAATQHVGATEEEIRTALLRPAINPAMVSEVLARLREELYYLRYRDRRYLFEAKPNLNKVILDFESEISEEALDQAMEEKLREVAGSGMGTFLMVIAPKEPQFVPDRPQPTLVLLPWDLGDAKAVQEWMRRAVESAAEGIRTNRNMLIFLAPDPGRLQPVRAALRRWLALDQARNSSSFKDFDREDRQQIDSQARDKLNEVKAVFLHAYQDIYRPSEDGVELVPTQAREASKASTLDEYVGETLRQAGILAEKLAPQYLKQTLRLEERQEVPISQIENVFSGVAGQVIPAKTDVVKQAVLEGCRQGEFALLVKDKIYTGDEVTEDLLSDSSATLVSPEVSRPAPAPSATPRPARLRLSTSTSHLYAILKSAELLSKLPSASASLEIRDDSGELWRKKEEIDEIAKSFGCSLQWEEAAPESGTVAGA